MAVLTEELKKSIDARQELISVVLVPDIRGEAGRHRRRVKGKNQHSDDGSDQRARTRNQVAEAKPFGCETNPANGAEACEHAGNVKPAQGHAVARFDEPSCASA